jgi:PHD/YefM family antitoxin component YafN of YafNO toxin-antitoxin module
MESLREIRPIAELEEATARLVRQTAAEHRTVLFTDESGMDQAVLMDAESYLKWRETTALLQLIAQGEADIEAGRLVSQEEAFDRADQAISHPRRPTG